MKAENFDITKLLVMAHSPVFNYAIPGLTSWLIGNPSPSGTIRLFTCSREHQENIIPHSHRFDFQCWVLSGFVANRIWTPQFHFKDDADHYQSSTLTYLDEIGSYSVEANEPWSYEYTDSHYSAGECYSMQHDEVHSIFFSRGAKVLFFEGPTLTNKSTILEPYVDGKAVPTFEVKPWMFQREVTSND